MIRLLEEFANMAQPANDLLNKEQFKNLARLLGFDPKNPVKMISGRYKVKEPGSKIGRMMQISVTSAIGHPNEAPSKEDICNSFDIAGHVLKYVKDAVCIVVCAKGDS